MNNPRRIFLFSALILCAILTLILTIEPIKAHETNKHPWIVGTVLDAQKQPVANAHIFLVNEDRDVIISEIYSQNDGHFSFDHLENTPSSIAVYVQRPHFKEGNYLTQVATLGKKR